MKRQIGVGLGIPDIRIDAVENADEVPAALAKKTVEAESSIRRLYFSGIGGRDCGNALRRDDTSLEKIDVAIVFEACTVKIFPAES